MIKMLTAYTNEIDDIDIATEEILKQLDIENNLLKNSLGILTCYSEFIDSGVVEALCKKLPFEVIGGTTLANSVPAQIGQMMLALTVLTSDDAEFSASVSENIDQENIENLNKEISTAYTKAVAGLKSEPKLIFTVTQLFMKLAGDSVVEAFDKASGGVPLFGTLAVDHTVTYEKTQTIFNGKAYKNAIVMAAVCGNVEPKFSIVSVSPNKILKHLAVITESKGNLLIGVNGVPATEYLASIGLSPEKIKNYNAVPFMISDKRASQFIARGIFGMMENGSVICGGTMPVGCNLSVGSMDRSEVIATTKDMMNKILASSDSCGLLAFSCIARNLILGVDTTAEMEAAKEVLGNKIPYSFNYSGGEICPVYNNEGKLENRFHNYTLVVCRF
jgi:hypothetical protein